MTAPLLDHDTTTRNEESTDTPPMRHYWRQMDILRGMTEGTPAVALCGYKGVPQRNGEGLGVCPPCKAVYDDDLAMSILTPDN